jgi:hypothetical protein
MKPNRPLKPDRERAIFARFASVARPDIDLATVQSCQPPAPDITCSTATGERLAFELVELCPPELAKVEGDALKVAKAKGDALKATISATAVLTADPTHRDLLKKLRKSYASDGPVDLLCYADGLLVTPDDVALEEMRALVDAEGLGPFRSIWFHGEDGVYLVAPARAPGG